MNLSTCRDFLGIVKFSQSKQITSIKIENNYVAVFHRHSARVGGGRDQPLLHNSKSEKSFSYSKNFRTETKAILLALSEEV